MNKKLITVLATTVIGVGVTVGSVEARPEPNFIVGTNGPDVLIGTRHTDVIRGLGGADLLVGREGNDVLFGGSGNDTLRDAFPRGHSGRDVLRGGSGHDRCVGDRADRFVSCEDVVIRPG